MGGARRRILTAWGVGLLAWPGVAPAQTGSAPRTVLVVGDSLSAEYGLRRGAGWVALLETRLRRERPGWGVFNASVSGETTAGGHSRLDALLAKHRPGVVIIELGGNDALRGLDLQATERNLDAMIVATQKAGARALLVGMRMPPNYGRTYGERFEAMYRQLASQRRCAWVPFLLEGVAERNDWFQADRIHPNESAQARMLENVWPALRPLL